MPQPPGGDSEASSSSPNFELPRHGAIREDNWADYQTQGFVPVHNVEDSKDVFFLRVEQNAFGVENTYTGDAYDYDEQRPLRHKPGFGIYTNPAGLQHNKHQRTKWQTFHRKASQSSDDPAAS